MSNSSANQHVLNGRGQGHTPSASRTRLRPVSDLPDVYRSMFKFGVFNAVQSTCFELILETDENVVISGTVYPLNSFYVRGLIIPAAPTGSGKTVLFELAVIRMLCASRESGQQVKSVYIAPTKALCSERFRDWSAKFEPMGIKCCELTGDTVTFGKGAWSDAKHASVMYGEKWDSLTRNWQQHGSILSQIRLSLIDEVHILNESRGSTLEVVVSRMKARGTKVRFVMVSATVPNIRDIASWVGRSRSRDLPATVFEFGEEFRPCKLTRHVVGIPRQKHQNDFQFARVLDYRLFETLQMYSQNKPILIFVPTRKGVFSTAEQLMKDYRDAETKKKQLPWTKPGRMSLNFRDKRAAELAEYGVGMHHAGLAIDDRRMIEDLFLKKHLRVVVATSTLAVGVNLPAHTVVVKGVHIFQNNSSVEYSDLDLIQMLGRAGRPQFADKDGVAIILCESELEGKYRSLIKGTTVIESSLHVNICEHINSEIGLGTITTVGTAKEWLRSSFLFQRVRQNPEHYAINKGESQTWEECIDDLVLKSIAELKNNKLITYENGNGGDFGELKSTEYGDIMSKLYIKQSTMALILALPKKVVMRDVVFNKLRRHNDIRYEVKKVEKTSDKVFLLIQAVLGGISLNSPDYRSGDSQPSLEAFAIWKHVIRVARAVIEVAIVRKRGAQLKYGLDALRCLTAKAWEDRPVVLRQLSQIGEKSKRYMGRRLQVLAEHGINSLQSLRKQNPLRIELLLNRKPPFGHEIIASLNEMPQYALKLKEIEVTASDGKKPVQVELNIECGLLVPRTKSNNKSPRSFDMTAILTLTSDMDFIDFRRISTRQLAEKKSYDLEFELSKPSQSVVVYITSERDLEGLEEMEGFWLSEEDFEDDELPSSAPPVKALLDCSTNGSYEVSTIPRNKVLSAAPNKASFEGHHPVRQIFCRCNHTCKDKTKCRHLCCRDGLDEPPHKRPSAAKKDGPDRAAKQSTPSTTKKNTSSSTKKSIPVKNKIRPPDRRLAELERLHEKAGVSSNLKLPEGKRIKLAHSGVKRKLDFDVHWSDLNNDGGQADDSGHNLKELQDDDDEFPEPLDILNAISKKTKQPLSSETTNYSDSEFDALIRDAPDELLESGDLISCDKKVTASTRTGKRKRPLRQNDSPRHVKPKLEPIDVIEMSDSSLSSPAVEEPEVTANKISLCFCLFSV
ncbi:P-loop containing nucleoside triphosphate hydrolase protein [Fistulina hepatica ATCC 64428]|uniref:DNA 3'-5' helicase n=1 Tax=Fistulina hepatica ATCC 64428 TaxID=1128425 RepID=A0A0D6ZZF7_9AGAR|nr:P-loop containing nucleoside triphosphate hydrolase protein [Fistulina hepatica ATCC 64428]